MRYRELGKTGPPTRQAARPPSCLFLFLFSSGQWQPVPCHCPLDPSRSVQSMSNQNKAYACAGATILAWSTVSTAFKVSLEHLTPMQLICVSMLTAALFLLGMLAVQRRLGDLRALSGQQWGRAVLLGVMLFCYYVLLFLAYDTLPAQIAQPINYTWALMLALLSAVFLGQKLTLKEFGCMLLAYGGVLVITSGAGGVLGDPDPLGLCCVLASTLLYALFWIVNTRCALPALPGFAICFGVAFLLALVVLLVQGAALLVPLQAALGGIYVGLFELSIPFVLWGQALRLTSSVARLSTLPFLVPFLALFWISLVLGEPIAWTTILGLAVIVLGTLMQQRLSAQHRSPRS